jgi:hypothetical protein
MCRALPRRKTLQKEFQKLTKKIANKGLKYSRTFLAAHRVKMNFRIGFNKKNKLQNNS